MDTISIAIPVSLRRQLGATMRFRALITRLNGSQITMDICCESLTQAEQIARDYLRDGETLTVESNSTVTEANTHETV